jgi:hypothetical protein
MREGDAEQRRGTLPFTAAPQQVAEHMGQGAPPRGPLLPPPRYDGQEQEMRIAAERRSSERQRDQSRQSSRFTSLAGWCADSGDHPAVALLSLNLRFDSTYCRYSLGVGMSDSHITMFRRTMGSWSGKLRKSLRVIAIDIDRDLLEVARHRLTESEGRGPKERTEGCA